MTKKEASIIVIEEFSKSGLIIGDYIFEGQIYSDKEVDKINQAIDNFTNSLRVRANALKKTDEKKS